MTPYHFFYVYVLESIRRAGELYIGSTHDLRKRLSEHNTGHVSSTKRYMPWKLIYYEAFSKKSLTRTREWRLKNNGNAMLELKKRIGASGRKSGKGFTLIETLVAISLLVIAIAGPMSLAAQSLSSAFYARDQMTAFHLAQEGIEAVRSLRDGNILRNSSGTPTNLMAGIPSTNGAPFTVDIRFQDPSDSMKLCSGVCEPLKNNGTLFGYGTDSSWQPTRFTRTVRVNFVEGSTDEIRVQVETRWRSGAFQERSFIMTENLYRWVPDDTST